MASAVTRQTIRCKIQFESDMKAMKMKLNGRSWLVVGVASAVTRQTIRCKIQFESDMKAMKMKLNGRSWFLQVT